MRSTGSALKTFRSIALVLASVLALSTIAVGSSIAGTRTPDAARAAAASEPTPAWYLAEGSTAWGFSTYISIVNPNYSAVDVDFTYMTATNGDVAGPTVHMPATSQAIVYPNETLGEQDFSTKVQCKDSAKSICVDRTMFFEASYAGARGVHNSVGVTAPAKMWYLPEGSSNWGFETWLLIQNPNAATVKCFVTYMIEGEGPRTIPRTILANSRQSFNMANDVGAKDASIMVESDLPVIPERSMYKYWTPPHPTDPKTFRREGHCSIGTTTPSTIYYFAEGSTNYGFSTYVLIQNPNQTPVYVDLAYYIPGSFDFNREIYIPGYSRKTIHVNDQLQNKDFSICVSGTQPIIAERAMYWAGTGGEGMHDSIGINAPHSTWYLPDGESFPPLDADTRTETFTCVENPNSATVHVIVTYLMSDGSPPRVIADEDIPSSSRRRTYNLADAFTGTNDVRAGIMVQCTTPGMKIVCERSMYFGENRFAGSCTIGGYGD